MFNYLIITHFCSTFSTFFCVFCDHSCFKPTLNDRLNYFIGVCLSQYKRTRWKTVSEIGIWLEWLLIRSNVSYCNDLPWKSVPFTKTFFNWWWHVFAKLKLQIGSFEKNLDVDDCYWAIWSDRAKPFYKSHSPTFSSEKKIFFFMEMTVFSLFLNLSLP